MTRKLVIHLEGTSSDLVGEGGTDGVSLQFVETFAERLRGAFQRSEAIVHFSRHGQEADLRSIRASEVDVLLVDAQPGRLHLDLVPAAPAAPAAPASAGDGLLLLKKVLERLISDLSLLAREPSSGDVPKALRALVAAVPRGVRQRYSVMEDDRLERQVEVTWAALGEAGAPAPAPVSVDQRKAIVHGVICAPRPAVILDTEEGRVQASTSAQWMDAAWALRDRDDLIATIVTNSSGARLLAIRPADEQAARARVPSVEETLDRFDGVLRILAQ